MENMFLNHNVIQFTHDVLISIASHLSHLEWHKRNPMIIFIGLRKSEVSPARNVSFLKVGATG
jgi:hypothetical protein